VEIPSSGVGKLVYRMVPDVLRSRKKKFLFQILRQGVVFLELQQHNPDLVADALRRSRENLALAAAKWVMFSAEFYLKRIRSIPDYPEYLRFKRSLEYMDDRDWSAGSGRSKDLQLSVGMYSLI
jgi:hypothetical protein